jgi:hypothetical protein
MKRKYFGYFLILFLVQTLLRPYVVLLQAPVVEDSFNMASLVALLGFIALRNKEKKLFTNQEVK